MLKYACIRIGVILTSSFTGFGFDLIGARNIDEVTIRTNLQIPESFGIRTYAVSDIDESCQRVLLGHTGPQAPEHSFTDLLDMVPGSDIKVLSFDRFCCKRP